MVLSAMAPDTMVAAVAAKTTWNIQSRKTAGSAPARKNWSRPNRPPRDPPYITAHPTAQKARAPAEKSIRFFMMMFPAFLARVRPVSTMAKPACMKNTKAAARSSQTKSKASERAATSRARSSPETASCAPAVPAKTVSSRARNRYIFFISSSPY